MVVRREDGRVGLIRQVRIAPAEMQAAALVPGLARAHDQVGHGHQIAQLDQGAADVELRVKLLDLALQQPDVVRRRTRVKVWVS